MKNKMNGIWDGHLIDSNGRTGTIKIYSEEREQPSLSIEIIERDTSPLILKGSTNINQTDNVIHTDAKIFLDNKQFSWTCDFKQRDAQPYAELAIIGIYSMSEQEDGKQSPLTQGVAILWKFK